MFLLLNLGQLGLNSGDWGADNSRLLAEDTSAVGVVFGTEAWKLRENYGQWGEQVFSFKVST